MKKVVFLRVITIIAIVFATLAILLSTTKMPNVEQNGFNRKYLNTELPVIKKAPIREVLSQISGTSNTSIFFQGQTPHELLILNKDLKHRDTLIVTVKIPTEKMIPFSVYVDTPMLYIHLNNMKSVIHGMFPKGGLRTTEIKTQIFSKSIQISPATCIIRAFHPSQRKQVFQKIDLMTGEVLIEKDVIEDTQDNTGGMSTDGMLIYEPVTAKVIFTEYLKNNFYCLDTNLNILYKKNTIDTITSSPVETKKIKQSDGSIKNVPSISRVQVNQQCFVDKTSLYIISAMRADNENLKDFNHHTVIDIYNINNGGYLGSVSMNKKDRKFKSAAMQHDTLIALYDKEIVYYRLKL